MLGHYGISDIVIGLSDDGWMPGGYNQIYCPESGRGAGIRLSVDITHIYRGGLKVSLVAPDGACLPLHGRAGGSADNFIRTYQISLLMVWWWT